MNVQTEVIHRVHYPDEGVSLEVGTDYEYGTMVQLRNSDTGSTAFFGKIDLTMPLGFAEALGNALLSVAKELRGNDGIR